MSGRWEETYSSAGLLFGLDLERHDLVAVVRHDRSGGVSESRHDHHHGDDARQRRGQLHVAAVDAAQERGRERRLVVPQSHEECGRERESWWRRSEAATRMKRLRERDTSPMTAALRTKPQPRPPKPNKTQTISRTRPSCSYERGLCVLGRARVLVHKLCQCHEAGERLLARGNDLVRRQDERVAAQFADVREQHLADRVGPVVAAARDLHRRR